MSTNQAIEKPLTAAQSKVLSRLMKQERAMIESPLSFSPYLSGLRNSTVNVLLRRDLVQIVFGLNHEHVALTDKGRRAVIGGSGIAEEHESKLGDALAEAIADSQRNYGTERTKHSFYRLMIQTRGW